MYPRSSGLHASKTFSSEWKIWLDSMRHKELAAFWCVCLRVMLGHVLQPRQKGDTVKRAGGGRGCVRRCYKPAPYTKGLLCRGSPQVTHMHTHSRSPPNCRSLPAADFIQIKQHAKKIWARAGENSEWKGGRKEQEPTQGFNLGLQCSFVSKSGLRGFGKEKTAGYRQCSIHIYNVDVNDSYAK